MENLLTTHYNGRQGARPGCSLPPIRSRAASSTPCRTPGAGRHHRGRPADRHRSGCRDRLDQADRRRRPASTIFKDTRNLAEQAIISTESILTGEEPEANDTETYDNGVKVVPSYLLEVQMVLQSNYEEIIVETGYYTEEQVEAGQL